MGLLDGDIRDLFGSVFGSYFKDGKLIKTTLIDNGRGDWDKSEVEHDCKIQKDSTFRSTTDTTGPEVSVTFLMLIAGLGVTAYTNDQLLYAGRKYTIMSVDSDPADSYWTIRGIPA